MNDKQESTREHQRVHQNPTGESGAIFSECRKYRYALWRRWDERPYVLFIGLNPSTADETVDDPTIRRCKQFAKDWGYGAVYMANLFAYRATKPAEMKKASEPVGPENDIWLLELSAGAGLVVAAWGVHGTHAQRDTDVIGLLGHMHCLGVTKNLDPLHPLYLPKTTKPFPYVAPSKG